MLIIEGSDNTGKTTMAKRMVELCPGTTYEHLGRPDENTFNFFLDYKPMIDANFVRDRFHIGGIVYHKNKITRQTLPVIEKWLQEVGSLIIIMYCSDERAYEQKLQDGRKQMFDNKQLIERNRDFIRIIHRMAPLQPHYDFGWDISPRKFSEFNYPNDTILKMWINEWLERKRKCSEKS